MDACPEATVVATIAVAPETEPTTLVPGVNDAPEVSPVSLVNNLMSNIYTLNLEEWSYVPATVSVPSSSSIFLSLVKPI